ncbi:hypothetical protein FOA52_004237 [Chlamydomonas sp. UWO 241]|nr:hypothetical protein FOA52_004237 [Chlamydomonas sp. UWO 241]
MPADQKEKVTQSRGTPEGGSSESAQSAKSDDGAPGSSSASAPGFTWGRFNVLKRLFFFDLERFMAYGYKHRLEATDVYPEPSLRTDHVDDEFSPTWERHLASGKPDLRIAVVQVYWRSLGFTGLLYGISQACSLAGPMLLQRIVAGISCQPLKEVPGYTGDCPERSYLYYYCIGLLLAPAIQAVTENHSNYLLYLMGTRIRNALMANIYRKCLRLSNSSMQAESTGKVITHMSNDAQKLQDAAFAIHSIWGSPVLIIVIIILMWYQIGWATFVCLGVVLVLIPIVAKLSAKQFSFRRELVLWTDKRIGLMSEVVTGIQMIKFYAWESPFRKEVMKFRNEEARILKEQAFWLGVFVTVLFIGPVIMSLLCFMSYSLSGVELTPAQAYATLAYISLLRFPMTVLPFLATMLMTAVVSLTRIQGFLLRPEASLAQSLGAGEEGMERGEIRIRGGEFSWDESAEKPSLTGVELSAKAGSLTMVVGSVGSGKSSLMSALVGHMSRQSGTLAVSGSIAYAAQTSWIMNDTLRENVLLGEEAEELRYNDALRVAQLGPDLAILPNGDLTEIGDRGVTLSGGQKQRVSIARALFSNADVYLLDDPLSAVDSHVGRALFEQCIQGALRDKTVLLVTNALQYLPMADNIVWMVDGGIKAQGTYRELQEHGMDFAELTHFEQDLAEEEEDKKAKDTLLSKMAPGPAAKGSDDASSTASDDDATTTTASVVLKDAPADDDKPLPEKSPLSFATSSVPGHHQLAAGGGPSGKSPRTGATPRAAPGLTTGQKELLDNTNRNLTGTEIREDGNVSMSVLTGYFKEGGTWHTWLLLGFLYVGEQFVRAFTDVWVGYWFSDRYGFGISPGGFYIGIYAIFGLTFALLTFWRSLEFRYMCVRAAVGIHNLLLDKILVLPKTFFDTNPTGRILNRFSRDTDIMDVTLCMSLSQFSNCIAILIANLIVISVATKWLGVALPPLMAVYVVIQRYYIPAARELQRIESVTRSPIYSKFGEALNGVPTIRAYRKEAHFTAVSDSLMEINAHAYATLKLTASWLAMRLDFLSILIITGTGALAIQGNISPSMAGLALLYALDLTRYLKQGTNMASQSESNLTSVERIMQYFPLEPEAASDTSPEVAKTLPPNWPAQGAIEIQELCMRYRPGMPLVLKGVSFSITAGEKVGLVGRTGSGKSSILLALFRMVEPASGRVLIDGVDCATLGVHHLRSKMSIIPQDPFMYKGTVRRNLDPLEEHGDEALWEVLEAVGLKVPITALDTKLDHMVVDNGNNFSLGQRQLFCMARAMLRKSRILMMDEATASIDLESDEAIQRAMRFMFAECTMLTIAHRLNTIMDSDQVVVLESGLVVEHGEPHALLQDHTGAFGSFVDQTGRSSSRHLRSLASSASMRRAGSRGKSVLGTGTFSPASSLRGNSGVQSSVPSSDPSSASRRHTMSRSFIAAQLIPEESGELTEADDTLEAADAARAAARGGEGAAGGSSSSTASGEERGAADSAAAGKVSEVVVEAAAPEHGVPVDDEVLPLPPPPACP